MDSGSRWPRILCMVGLIAMVIGCIDPLEGSLFILPGTGLLALGAYLGRSRYLNLACWALGMTAVGVGILFSLSALGGVGAETGRSMMWLLVVLPYPVGAILALVAGVRILMEMSRR